MNDVYLEFVNGEESVESGVDQSISQSGGPNEGL